MTRDEAVKIRKVKGWSMADTFVDTIAALKLLKLCEPRSACLVLSDLLGPEKAMQAMDVIDLAGLKIVEK